MKPINRKVKNLESIRVDVNGTQVQCLVKKSRRSKYIRLSFCSDGGLILHVPYLLLVKEIETILYRHKRWILKRMQQSEQAMGRKPPFSLKHGATLPLLQDHYRLNIRIEPGKSGYWQISDHTLHLSVPVKNNRWIYPGVELWYHSMAESFLSERTYFWAQKMQVEYRRIRVKNQRSLWGSCSGKKNLNFNWRIMLLTPSEADYLIIHELAHLREMNHSPNFWEIVATFFPEYCEVKRELQNKNHLLKFPPDSIYF